MKKRALFLDRDGIFNELVHYDGQPHSPRNWDELRHYAGLDGLKDVKRLGYLLVMITNQPDVERGMYPRSFVDEVNAHYRRQYDLDAVYACLFKSPDHPWKKPNPGMFLQAAEDHGIDLRQSFHVGDTLNDVEAATRCGVTPILWERAYNAKVECALRVRSVDEIVKMLSRS